MSQYGTDPGNWANRRTKSSWVVPVTVVVAIAVLVALLLWWA